LSANGSRLLVGAPASTVTGFANAGRAYLFERDAANNWSVELELGSPVAAANDYFGSSVDLTSDGLTIKVDSVLPIEPTWGEPEGRTHLWTYTDDSWVYQLAPQHPGDLCRSTRLSADGLTLVRYCFPTLEYTGNARMTTLKRQADGTWRFAPEFDLPYNETRPGTMAITYSGSWLAVNAGNIRIYQWTGTQWALDSNILPSSMDGSDRGEALEFSRHGEFLAVGDPSSKLFGAGVSDPTIGTDRDGAVSLWKYRPDVRPHFYSFKTVKATNPGIDDSFGTSVAFGSQGWYLAIGAPREDGAARGVDGDQDSEAASDSGAVYLY
jgi:hypothetical protein